MFPDSLLDVLNDFRPFADFTTNGKGKPILRVVPPLQEDLQEGEVKIAADPGRHVSELPLLNRTERRRSPGSGTTPPETILAIRCVHELFKIEAARTPDAAAVISLKASG